MDRFNAKGRLLGGAIGVLLSFLLSFPVSRLPAPYNVVVAIVMGMTLGIFGVMMGGEFLCRGGERRYYY